MREWFRATKKSRDQGGEKQLYKTKDASSPQSIPVNNTKSKRNFMNPFTRTHTHTRIQYKHRRAHLKLDYVTMTTVPTY